MENRIFTLLKSYCDRLISLQITERSDPAFYGGILCPACSSIHGRIGDTVYPFTYLYDRTGDERYLNAAKGVVDWSEANVLRPDGSYRNDTCSNWKAITVFSAIAFANTLLYHGDCLDAETKAKWTAIFNRQTRFVYASFGPDRMIRPNVNYYAAECGLMTLAYRLTGEAAYKEKAEKLFAGLKTCFTCDGLLFGEAPSTIAYAPTKEKDCYYVDLGYNVEESMPCLVTYAKHLGTDDDLRFVADRFLDHMAFLLPDGGWDGSTGSRANKWTYWGSRTSDGCGEGLAHLAHLDPVFGEAAWRNFELLERCSKDGCLYGGLMYQSYGEQPCIHHTFAHAKCLAGMLDAGFTHTTRVPLPRETAYGIKRLDSIRTSLIAHGIWRGTVTDSDAAPYEGSVVSGGTLSMLWTEKTGPVLASVMARFGMSEPRNMQLSLSDDTMPNCALRIVRGAYDSVCDKTATVAGAQDRDGITVTASGVLRECGKFTSDAAYRLTYRFTEDTLTVTAWCEKDADLLVPVITDRTDCVTVTAEGVCIAKPQASVVVSADGSFDCPDPDFRNFTVIGGFGSYPVRLSLTAGEERTVVIRVK